MNIERPAYDRQPPSRVGVQGVRRNRPLQRTPSWTGSRGLDPTQRHRPNQALCGSLFAKTGPSLRSGRMAPPARRGEPCCVFRHPKWHVRKPESQVAREENRIGATIFPRGFRVVPTVGLFPVTPDATIERLDAGCGIGVADDTYPGGGAARRHTHPHPFRLRFAFQVPATGATKRTVMGKTAFSHVGLMPAVPRLGQVVCRAGDRQLPKMRLRSATGTRRPAGDSWAMTWLSRSSSMVTPSRETRLISSSY